MFSLTTKYISSDKCYFYFREDGYVVILSEVEGPMVTINHIVNDIDFPKEIAIKNYSENIGIYNELLRLGVIGECTREISTGYTSLLICPFYKDKAESL